jgi:phage shock protein A
MPKDNHIMPKDNHITAKLNENKLFKERWKVLAAEPNAAPITEKNTSSDAVKEFNKQINLLAGIEKFIQPLKGQPPLSEEQLKTIQQEHKKRLVETRRTLDKQPESLEKTMMKDALKPHEEIGLKLSQIMETCSALDRIIHKIDECESRLDDLKKGRTLLENLKESPITSYEKDQFSKLKKALTDQKNKFIRGEISTDELNTICSKDINHYVHKLEPRRMARLTLPRYLYIHPITTKTGDVLTLTLPENVSMSRLIQALEKPAVATVEPTQPVHNIKVLLQNELKERFQKLPENNDPAEPNAAPQIK